MARKGKLLKKASASGPFKRDRIISTEASSKNEKSTGKLFAKKNLGQGSIAKQVFGDLGGLIFMCNGTTKPDCFKYRVFGLNEGKKNLVDQVRKGMRLFLFDVDLRLLYGIYIASSQGTYKLERDAFGGGFPWQVRFSIQKDCLPLPEDIFQAAIKENYVDRRRFKMELTTEQVHRLVKLFRPLPLRGHSPPRPRISAFDHSAPSLMPGAPRLPEIDRYSQGFMLPRGLSPSSKYETGLFPSNTGPPPPLTKYDAGFTSSDRYAEHRFAERQIPEHQSLTKYAQLFPSDDRHIAERHTLDDLLLGRDLQLQHDVGSLGLRHGLIPLSFSAVNADPLHSVSDLHKLRGRDEFLSAYSEAEGSALGADVDLYQQRLRLADVRANLLERRASGFEPLPESYTSGLSSDISRGRSASDTYGSSSAGMLGTPGLALRGDILPHSRYY